MRSLEDYYKYQPHFFSFFSMLDSFQDGVVLEIGCGSGKALLELKAKYPRMQVYGTNLRGYGYSQTNGSIESFWSIALYFGIPVLCDVHGSPGFPIVQETEKIQSPKFADVLPRIGFDFIFSRHSLNEGKLQSFESPLAITQLLPLLKEGRSAMIHLLGGKLHPSTDIRFYPVLSVTNIAPKQPNATGGHGRVSIVLYSTLCYLQLHCLGVVIRRCLGNVPGASPCHAAL